MNIRVTSAQLAAALPGVMPVSHCLEMPVSVPHFRFESSQIDDDKSAIMTAFALGPGDKGTVMSLYLLEAIKWRKQYPEIMEDYRHSAFEADMAQQELLRTDKDRRHDLSRELTAVAENELLSLDARMSYLSEDADHAGPGRREPGVCLMERPEGCVTENICR